jgi:hypothetical protein
MTCILLNLSKFNKIDNDSKIIKFLKTYKKPAPPLVICLVTNLRNDKCSQRLKQLEKFSIVKIAYKRTIPFYELVGEDK